MREVDVEGGVAGGVGWVTGGGRRGGVPEGGEGLGVGGHPLCLRVIGKTGMRVEV